MSKKIKNVLLGWLMIFGLLSCKQHNVKENVVIQAGCFNYLSVVENNGTVKGVQIYLKSPLSRQSKNAEIELVRWVNFPFFDGSSVSTEKELDADRYSIANSFVSFIPENNSISIQHSPKGSSSKTDMILSNIISLKYDSQEDVLLLKLRTGLRDKDGANPTYILSRSNFRFPITVN